VDANALDADTTALIEALPDLIAFLRPDGLITQHLGGRNLPMLRGAGNLTGRPLEQILPAAAADLLRRLVRRALSTRMECEADFTVDTVAHHVRVLPQRPDRVLCMIKSLTAALPANPPADAQASGVHDRRSFIQAFQNSVSDCLLRERPLALCLMYLEGVGEISRLVDFAVGDRMLAKMLSRLPASGPPTDAVSWYFGQIGSVVIGAVIDGTDDRNHVREIIAAATGALQLPVPMGEARFHCSPRTGVALLGEDASRANLLFDQANAAMHEARRGEAGTVHFYSDTLRMLPTSRLDVERELRLAITTRQIRMRYVARHDLRTGRVIGVQAYIRWQHPLRGEIAPAEFLPIAAATGLAVELSRAALERLVADVGALRTAAGADVVISFAALRQHVSSGQLLQDCGDMAKTGQLDMHRLELRIAERTLAAMTHPERALQEMVALGARVFIDEFGGGYCSLAQLPLLPLAGLQIDRRLVVSASADSAAMRSCRAIIGLAKALDVTPVAAGIDAERTRQAMLELGCEQGLGDLYPRITPASLTDARPLPRAVSSA
jgi:predicted signal transduction protein with EAL and GGDEF domain